MKIKIKKVSMEQAKEIIKERLPLGKFFLKGENCILAIENTAGDAEVGKFETEEAAIKWLAK